MKFEEGTILAPDNGGDLRYLITNATSVIGDDGKIRAHYRVIKWYDNNREFHPNSERHDADIMENWFDGSGRIVDEDPPPIVRGFQF